jgi:hypothetical protein
MPELDTIPAIVWPSYNKSFSTGRAATHWDTTRGIVAAKRPADQHPFVPAKAGTQSSRKNELSFELGERE